MTETKKYRVWWNVNFIQPSFEPMVQSPLHGYIAIETFAALDLGKPEYIEKTLADIKLQTGLDYTHYSNNIGDQYRQYRRKHSINSHHLITDNMSDFTIFEDGEWCTWHDEETGMDLKELVSNMEESKKDWAKYLLELETV